MRNAFILGVTAGLLLLSAPAFAADRNVDVINNTDKPIAKFYASRDNLKNWEENILHGDPIKPGETQPIDIDDGSGGCKYDFKAVFSDGSESVNSDVDVCTTSSVTYQ